MDIEKSAGVEGKDGDLLVKIAIFLVLPPIHTLKYMSEILTHSIGQFIMVRYSHLFSFTYDSGIKPAVVYCCCQLNNLLEAL